MVRQQLAGLRLSAWCVLNNSAKPKPYTTSNLISSDAIQVSLRQSQSLSSAKEPFALPHCSESPASSNSVG